MVNEATKTIASFARNRLLSVGLCERGTQNIPIYTHDLKPILTEVRVLKIVNEAPETIASFARNRLLSVGLCEKRYVENNLS
jgi:hypothetical protein